MKTKIPQWVIDYNNAGHQSSAGKAIKILMYEHQRITEENERLREGVIEAKWFVDHVMGKEKRVDWGKTFNIDWGHLNTALISIQKAFNLIK